MKDGFLLKQNLFVFLGLALLLLLPVKHYSIGVPDQTFGSGGLVTTDLGSEASVKDIRQQSDGKIVLLARNNNSMILLRYNTDGSPDQTFGTGGRIVTAYNSGDAKVSLTLQTNGLFAVGNNSSVTRYTSGGAVSETITFPTGDFAAFGADGKIATATLIPANGTCSTQNNKIQYGVYNPDGSSSSSVQFCSGGTGTTGVTSIWGIVPSATNTFYVGYTHQALSASGGRVREMLGESTVQDAQVDIGNAGYSLVDLAATLNNGFVSLGYFRITRQLPVLQGINTAATPPAAPIYTKVHGNGLTAALQGNSQLLALNENFLYAGVANIGRFFGEAVRPSAVYVQSDNEILVAGQVPSGQNYHNIGIVRYSTVRGGLDKSGDFDADSKTDLAVWRPSSRTWYVQNSATGSFNIFQFGSSDDRPVPGDYDNDGKTDAAMSQQATGVWYWLKSSNNTFTAYNFGTAGDLPVPADYSGDGKSELAVYRPSDASWWIAQSDGSSYYSRQFGLAGDKPTIGDFDGDGKADLAVYHPSTGVWSRSESSTGQIAAYQFGLSTDIPTPADFDGDGKTDLAVYRPSTGTWYRVNSATGSFTIVNFGLAEDKPVPGDYDGDGKADIAVYRPSTGVWYLLRSTQGFAAQQFGINEDIPLPNAFIR